MKSEQLVVMRSATDRLHRVLILGGTGEAAQLARRLSERSDLTVISSLAGRVERPVMPAGFVRTGGFGGVPGLVEYLIRERISVVMDATHPFAAKISSHAELACKQTNIPLIAFERPAWTPLQGDRWVQVPDNESAAALVDNSQNRIFLSVGRQELAAFSRCSNAWFLIRTIDQPAVPLPSKSRLLLSRGPFHLDEERQLLRLEAITHIVSKNSGGSATYAKIEAARQLEITVILVDRPTVARISPCTGIEQVYFQLEHLLTGSSPLRHETKKR